MIPGVNGNAVSGAIPQTRSQAGVDVAPEPTPPPMGTVPVTVVAPAPVKLNACSDCKVTEYTVKRLNNEIAAAALALEYAKAETAEMAQKLAASSGATVNGRMAETITRLQRHDITQRNDIWSLEQINAHQSHEARELRAELRRAKGYPELVPTADERPFTRLVLDTQLELF